MRVMEEIESLIEEIGRRASEEKATVGVAESLTGGLVTQELAKADGASGWLRGGIVAYNREVKHRLLDVDASKIVSERAALAMAAGARTALAADLTVALTGVGGPQEEDGEPPGTVWIATDDGRRPDATLHRSTENFPTSVNKRRLLRWRRCVTGSPTIGKTSPTDANQTGTRNAGRSKPCRRAPQHRRQLEIASTRSPTLVSSMLRATSAWLTTPTRS